MDQKLAHGERLRGGGGGCADRFSGLFDVVEKAQENLRQGLVAAGQVVEAMALEANYVIFSTRRGVGRGSGGERNCERKEE